MTTPKTGSKARRPTDDGEDCCESALDLAVQGTIGRKLRDTYEQVVKEQVPDKFLLLLQELKEREAGSKKVDS